MYVMYSLACVIGLITSSIAYSCHRCICTRWMEVMSCVGVNVTAINNHPFWVSHLDVLNTTVSLFPSLTKKEWPNLSSVDFRDNPHLKCSEISEFRENRPDLMVTSDCQYQLISELEVDNNLNWLNVLGLFPVICSIMLVTYFKRKRYDSYVPKDNCLEEMHPI
jgi:hypothetical protein